MSVRAPRFARIPDVRYFPPPTIGGMGEGVVGRERELQALRTLVGEVSTGRGGALVLVGAPGMGKSRLLASARQRARRSGLRVVEVPCDESGRSVPHATAAALTAALGATIEAGPGAMAEVVISQAAGTGPLLVQVDDAQWLDSASLSFLVALVETVAEAPIGLMVATRPPSPESGAVQRLLATLERRGVPISHLEALSEEEAVELVTAATGAGIDDDQRAVLATATGNPFLVLELANAWRTGHRPRPESLLLHTISELSAPARGLLDHASVLGRDALIVDLARLARCTAVDLVDPVREVTGAGLVDGSRDRLRFRHDLIRDAIYGRLPSAVRAAIHMEAAGALEARGAPAIEVAPHLVEGAQPGDSHAVERLRAAAASAAPVDMQAAITLLEAARRLCVDHDVASSIDRRLVVLYGWTGRSSDAIALAERLLARATDPRQEARLRASLAEAISLGGDEESGAKEAERALLIPDLPDRVRASLLVLASTGLWESHPDRCRELTAEARSLAAGDAAVTIAAIQHEAVSYSAELALVPSLERSREGSRWARAAVETDQFLAASRLTWALTNEAEACLATDRVDEGLRLLHEAEQRARRAGLSPSQVADHCAMRAEGQILLCRWDDASAELDARVRVLSDNGLADSSASGIPARTASARARIAVLVGEDDAAELLDRWTEVVDSEVERARVAMWKMHLGVRRGDHDFAQRHALEALSVMRSLRSAETCASRAFGWQASWVELVLVLVEGGRTAEADDVIAVMREPVQANVGLARWEADGLVADAVRSRPDRLLDAAARAEAIPSALPRFRVLSEVQHAARLMGAPDVATRVEPLLLSLAAEHGLVRPGPSLGRHRSTAARPRTGWESLTPSEQRVARLVADGLSNQSIADDLLISRYTVETHLKRVFQKLHFSSRLELAAFVIRSQS